MVDELDTNRMPHYLSITKRYYAEWLDVDPAALDSPGVFAVPSPRREERQAGYPRASELYCFISGATTVISYHRRFQDRIGNLVQLFAHDGDLEQTKAGLAELLDVAPGRACTHAYKYRFVRLPDGLDTTLARQLIRDDYADFLAFHTAQYPDAHQESWLQAYFNEIADKGYVYGIYADGRLVSATDVPDLPYMADVVVEPGINTLPGYRRRGYARTVVGALLKQWLREGKVPLWSCSASNVGSQRLAESLGYAKLADVITISQ
ncbi:MAG: GNAT family N-acetyltransferase [Anaerolineae bacterium]|nr:GNAT family N-acetyltransferase [Anaerolineae bacterium]